MPVNPFLLNHALLKNSVVVDSARNASSPKLAKPVTGKTVGPS